MARPPLIFAYKLVINTRKQRKIFRLKKQSLDQYMTQPQEESPHKEEEVIFYRKF